MLWDEGALVATLTELVARALRQKVAALPIR